MNSEQQITCFWCGKPIEGQHVTVSEAGKPDVHGHIACAHDDAVPGLDDLEPSIHEPQAKQLYSGSLREDCAAVAKFLPGPWHLCFDGQIDADNGKHVCGFRWNTWKEWNDSEELKATSRLIAAAPDMYLALGAARMFIRNGIELGYIRMPDANCPDPAHKTLPKIEEALAKAIGNP